MRVIGYNSRVFHNSFLSLNYVVNGVLDENYLSSIHDHESFQFNDLLMYSTEHG